MSNVKLPLDYILCEQSFVFVLVIWQEPFFNHINRFLDLYPPHVFFVTKRIIKISTIKHFIEL